MTEVCDTFPNCPAAQVATEQTRNNKEVNSKLDAIATHQKGFSEAITAIGFQLADIKYITSKLNELKDENSKDHDEMFSRIRAVERLKAERTDIIRIESAALGWRTKGILASVSVILALGMFLLGHFLQ